MHTTQVTTRENDDFRGSAERNGSPGASSALLAFSVIVALALSAWLVFSVSVSQVSAAANDDSSMPQVPYFPSQYVNQASEPSAVPATF